MAKLLKLFLENSGISQIVTLSIQWEFMDANTVRTYEIPIHISPHALENYPEFAFPPGFTPSQQFPYNVSSASSQVSFLAYRLTQGFFQVNLHELSQKSKVNFI